MPFDGPLGGDGSRERHLARLVAPEYWPHLELIVEGMQMQMLAAGAELHTLRWWTKGWLSEEGVRVIRCFGLARDHHRPVED